MPIFPEGHGKGPCDGHFGKMRLWKEQEAKVRVIAECKDYVAVMNQRANLAKTQNAKSPACVFIDWEPPPKATLPEAVLCSKSLRAKDMGVRSTYHWSSTRVLNIPTVHRHGFVNGPIVSSCAPPLLPKVAADADDDAAGAGAWQTYYRLKSQRSWRLS